MSKWLPFFWFILISGCTQLAHAKTPPEEIILIKKIVNRARRGNPDVPLVDAMMDITATHCNGCPLDLKKFLKADAFNFGHDFYGIRAHVSRETGKLTRCFLPRCAR